MKRLLEIFYELSDKPRCSGNSGEAFEYILNFSKLDTKSDKAGNILIRSSNPKIAFQAHYDMVCIGEQPPKIYEKDGELRARNGTLGADNGIGVAMMLRMIELGYEAEYLFTNDEEIGLIGANNLELDLISDKLINLDSEWDDEVTIGCAGGADHRLSCDFDYVGIDPNRFSAYEISAVDCKGGHSGVDIDKEIVSANKAVVDFLVKHDAKLFSFIGGERRNSISKHATAQAWFQSDLINHENISVKKIDLEPKAIRSDCVLKALDLIPHGVLRKDEKVMQSANLAIVDIQNGKATIDITVRGNSELDLINANNLVKSVAKECGFDIRSDGKYPPWEMEEGEFTHKVLRLFGDAKLSTIHAGLECAILKKKFPNTQMLSIGPNIHLPHSSGESVEIASIEKVFNIIKRLYSEL